MAETFPAIIKPTIDTVESITPLVNDIELGDGYDQIAGTGLNSMREVFSLKWVLNEADKQTVIAFFKATEGHRYFNWTVPEPGYTESQYIVKSWNKKQLGGGSYAINAVFKEYVGYA